MQLTQLGPYEIDKPLGKGGMGSVYAATDTQTGQRVAIKALTPHLAMAEGFRERFEAEIESLKTLRHEGIVRLYGYGEQDGVLFYSMELVEGISLEDELKAGRRFNWREVTNIAIQLSLALKHAHDHGIVHRDIKPANILLYGEDRVKLADFGIARLFGTTAADDGRRRAGHGRLHVAGAGRRPAGDGALRSIQPGRRDVRAVGGPAAVSAPRTCRRCCSCSDSPSPEPVRRYAPDTPEQLERVIMQLLGEGSGRAISQHASARAAFAGDGRWRCRDRRRDDFALAGEHPADRQHEPNDLIIRWRSK